MNNFPPTYLLNMFTTRSEVHNRLTRNNQLLEIPPFKSDTGQRTFQYRATEIWNDLDDDLKQIPSLAKFKKNLQNNY